MAGIKTDPRVRKTRLAIRRALVELMQKKDYDAITVTDISESAQINRKTFYAHYETKEQLCAQMLYEMFEDMFGTLMYEKEMPGEELDEEKLIQDVAGFFRSVESYREELETLIGGKTTYMAFEIADDVIRRGMNRIHVTVREADGSIPASLLVTRIKNFFFTGIDWWLEQRQYSPEQAAEIYARLMRRSAVNIFRYQRMQSIHKEKEN